MFGKNYKTRFDETIAYISRKNAGLALHLKSLIPNTSVEAISKQISLGYRSDGEDDQNFENNTNKRQALRAILLCQRVYFSSMWAGQTAGSHPFTYSQRDYHTGNWKKTSLDHWKSKSEMDILQGLAMFYPAAAAAGPAVAAAATVRPSGAVPDYTMSRLSPSCPGDATTCYNAVCAWLLKSGVVSYRWYMKDTTPTQKDSLTRMFGAGVQIWAPDTPFTELSAFPVVPAGHIVHMWDENTGINGWNGHWIVSIGGGLGYGCNNGAIEVDVWNGGQKADRDHSLLSLKGQFLQYNTEMKKTIDEVGEKPRWESYNPKRYQRGTAVMFDPLQLPGRL